MGWVRWLGVWLMTIPLVALGTLWPLLENDGPGGGAPSTDPVVFTEYRADYLVDGDGTLWATETITADFPANRHGIFRYWDITNPNVPGVRQRPEVTSIRMDGQPVRHDKVYRAAKRFHAIRIGDPYSTLKPGQHVYEISYTIPGVLDPGKTGADLSFASTTGSTDPAPSVFFWNVVAPGWANRIEQAEITVRLPAPVTAAQCTVGWQTGRACEDVAVDDGTVTIRVSQLRPRTPVTLRAGVDIATPDRTELGWPMSWDRVMGTDPGGPLGALLLTALLGSFAVLMYRGTRERTPPFPLHYGPPEDIGPAQFEYILTKRTRRPALIATLFHLAERGAVQLHLPDGRTWSVRATATGVQPDTADPVSRAVAASLGVVHPGDSFTADGSVAAGRRLATTLAGIEDGLEQWAIGGGLIRHRTAVVAVVRCLAAAALLLAVLAACGVFPATIWVLPFALAFILCVPIWQPRYGMQRTERGGELWSRAGGFHRMLSTDSAEARFDFAAHRELYTANLPYAVVSGNAERWAEKFLVETGQSPPLPDWFASSDAGSAAVGLHGSHSGSRTAPTPASRLTGVDATFVDSFDRSLNTSIGAYRASLRATTGTSGSSGSRSWGGGSSRSGGGSSGGGSRGGGGGGGRGGGGGGGGSW